MKKCNNCGNIVNDDAIYCSNCGQNSFELNVTNNNVVQNQIVSQPEMGMTYAIVYIVLLCLVVLVQIVNLKQNFSAGTLMMLLFIIATIVLLTMRMKAGRILAMILNVIYIITGSLLLIGGVFYGIFGKQLFLNFLEDTPYLTVVPYIHILVTFILFLCGVLFIIFGICSFIYFKKRACMYTK